MLISNPHSIQNASIWTPFNSMKVTGMQVSHIVRFIDVPEEI